MVRFPVRRLAGFVVLPLISVLSPVLILPAIGRVMGAPGWAAIATGQSIGAAASILVAYGWPTVGPSEVSSALPAARAKLYIDSFYMRCGLLVPVMVVACGLSLFVVPASFRWSGMLMTAAFCTAGLSASWFYVGVGSPLRVAMYDAVPRLLATVVAFPLLVWLHVAALYPVLLLGLALVGIALGSMDATRGGRWGRPDLASIRLHFRRQWPISLSGIITSGYTGFSVALVAIAAGPLVNVVASFAAAFRLQSMAQTGLGTVANAFQGWVGERRHNDPGSRMVVAFGFTVATGFVGAIATAILLPWLVRVIFGAGIEVSESTALITGLGLLFYAATLSLSLHVLAPLRRIRTIALATILASIVGVPMIYALTLLDGTEGAMAGIVLAELVVFVIERPIGIRIMRRVPSEGQGSDNKGAVFETP